MTLRQYMDILAEIAKENPQALNMTVVTSSDAEGNSFSPVRFTPLVGIYERGNFISKTFFQEFGKKENETNAICVN
ncbi:MAG: hypothetical protein WBA74_25390 [Cyclobacteriaceae bacterium]